MAKQVGDNSTASIQWGGWTNVEVAIVRGETPSTETLLPSMDGRLKEEPVYEQGLDGRIDIRYYRQSLALDFVQTDGETLADLYAEQLDALFHESGVPVTLTWRNGYVSSLTMFIIRSLHNEGPGGHVGVILQFSSTSLIPMMRSV